MAANALFSDYSFGQLLGPQLSRDPATLLPNSPRERNHFLAARHQVFGHHYIHPFSTMQQTLEGPTPDAIIAAPPPIRMFFLWDTGTGKTSLSLLIMNRYLELTGVHIYVLGFDNTKEGFLADVFKFPELGFVSQSEYARLLQMRTAYYKTNDPVLRQELQMFTQRLRGRLTNRSRGSGIHFYGYQEFANRVGFGDDEARTPGAPVKINDTFVESLRGSFLVCDEIANTYNSVEMNDRGRALKHVLDKLGRDVHCITMTATPMNNHPAESVELAAFLNHGPLIRSDYFRDEQLIDEGRFAALFTNRISVVAASETHLYPTLRWPADATTLRGIGDDFKFETCAMSEFQLDALARSKSLESSVPEADSATHPDGSQSTYFLRDFAFPIPASKPPVACLTTAELNSHYKEVPLDLITEPQLRNYSAKYSRLVALLPKFRGKTMIFHPRVQWGVKLIEDIFAAHHYVTHNEGASQDTACALCGVAQRHHAKLDHPYKPSRYLSMNSTIDKGSLARNRSLFNAPTNLYGADYQYLIASMLIAEGYDFNSIENLVFCGFPDTWHTYIQVVGRARRKASHINLPPERRFVNVYILVNVDAASGTTPERYVIKYPTYEAINRCESLMRSQRLDNWDASQPPTKYRTNYYARELFRDEIANIYRVIKRLFVLQPIWTLPDLLARIHEPPINVSVNLATSLDSTIFFVLQKILYRPSDHHYLKIVKEFARTNDDVSCLFALDVNSKFFIRSQNGVNDVFVLMWRQPYFILRPIDINSMAVRDYILPQPSFIQYRVGMTGNEVNKLLNDNDIGPSLFERYKINIHEAAIRKLLENGGSNKVLQRFYASYGIIRSSNEYWTNSSGFKLDNNGTWVNVNIARPPFASHLGFYEDRRFKYIARGDLEDKKTDGRAALRGKACMNFSLEELAQIAKSLRIDSAKLGRSEVCGLIQATLLDQQKNHGNKATHVLFWPL